MSNLFLVRHGQSEWNLENRFTGWVDVDLSAQGKLEACKAGELIKEKEINFDFFFTSFQKRAIDTLKLIKTTMREKDINTIQAWQLNERHYGALTGLNKDQMRKKIGEKKVHEFRRSWNLAPDPLNKNNPYHPINIESYNSVPRDKIPDTESLEDTFNRVNPYFKEFIMTKLKQKKNILVSAHGNSIRAICKFLFKLDENEITKLEIPTGNPLHIIFDQENKISKCLYLDNARAKDLIVF
tara:strand:+ start:359 stop:1078 length:720 start_codon:yes stop_codon:yes gene_type:complete